MKVIRTLCKRWYVTLPALLCAVILAVGVFAPNALASLILPEHGDWSYEGLPGDYYLSRTSACNISIGTHEHTVGVLGHVYKVAWDGRYVYAARIFEPTDEQNRQAASAGYDDDAADYYILDAVDYPTSLAMTREEFQARYRLITGGEALEPEWQDSSSFAAARAEA